MITVYTGNLSEGPPEDRETIKPYADAQARYNKFKQSLCDKSARAKEIFELLEARSENVGVFINGGDVSMTSEYYPPNFKSEIFEVPASCTGGLAIFNVGYPIYVYDSKVGKRVPLPIEISLAHELGHAEQYFKDPGWFTSQFKIVNDPDAGADKRSAAKLAIENDNLARNERVICSQYDLPERERYD
jgi:hypothetical protein